MSDEDPVEIRNYPAEIDELSGIRITTGGIDQTGGKTERPLAHRLADRILHIGNFSRLRTAVFHSHGLQPHGAMRNQVSAVKRRTSPFDRGKVLFHRFPVPFAAEIAQQTCQLPCYLRTVRRSNRRHGYSVLPQHFQRDSLPHFHRKLRFRKHPKIGVTMGVDEPRGDDQSRAVDLLPAVQRLPNRGDPVAVDRHIGEESRATGPVDDCTSLEYQRSSGHVMQPLAGRLLECANGRSKLRQTKAVASYRTPNARPWSAQACLRLVSRQLPTRPKCPPPAPIHFQKVLP